MRGNSSLSLEIKDLVVPKTEVRRLDDADHHYSALEQGCPAPRALVIGVGIAQPVRVVHHARSLGADMPVLILSDGATREQLEQTLRFAPLIGCDVRLWSSDDLAELCALKGRLSGHRSVGSSEGPWPRPSGIWAERRRTRRR